MPISRYSQKQRSILVILFPCSVLALPVTRHWRNTHIGAKIRQLMKQKNQTGSKIRQLAERLGPYDDGFLTLSTSYNSSHISYIPYAAFEVLAHFRGRFVSGRAGLKRERLVCTSSRVFNLPVEMRQLGLQWRYGPTSCSIWI